MDTRKEILDAAARIFGEIGFHAASMQDIADAVNLKKGSLYYHVSSKQEILLELLDQALDLLNQRIRAAVRPAQSPGKKLTAAIQEYMDILTENQALSSVLLFDHRALKPTYRKKHIPARDEFEHIWREIIEDGRSSGEFEIDDPAVAVRAILGSLNWVVTWYRPDGALSPQEIAQQYIHLFLSGLNRR